MTIAAIIQARLASTRLPGKVLAPIAGRPMLWHVVRRTQQARTLTRVAVATSTQPSDDPIAAFCDEERILVFRGDEEDVLDRYYQAAHRFEAETIVRLTADCPLIDPEVIDAVVSAYRPEETDYVSNTIDRSYPDGLDTEVFGIAALDRAWREARWSSEREHVTPYIWKHPELFRLAQVRQTTDLSGLRWTVDEPRDLELVRALYARLDPDTFRMADVVSLLGVDRTLGAINAGIESNEGYRVSLERDRVVPGLEKP